MKRKILSLIGLTVLLLACSLPQKGMTNRNKTNSYLIKNISIIPINTTEILNNQTVWINNNEIKYIGDGKDLKITGKTKKIDGSGKYLMPGLSDMHVHLPSENLDRFLQLQLLNGVTTLRSMRGQDHHLKLRKKIEEGVTLGPNLYCATQPIHSRLEFTATQIDSIFERSKTAGFDLVKVLSVKDIETFEAITAASKKYQLPIGGHVPRNVGIKNILAAGSYSIEHLGGYLTALKDSEALFNEMIEQTITSNTYNCPTLDWYNIWQFSIEELRQRKGLEYVPKEVQRWENDWKDYLSKITPEQRVEDIQKTRDAISSKKELLKKLHQAGAMILISPDPEGMFQVPGFSLVEEMKIYRDAGISNFEILKMATWNAAQYMGKEDQKGSVEVGKMADLILLDNNPMTDIENLGSVSHVFINGKLFSHQDLKDAITKLDKK